jgi:hypothetical protein
MADYNSIRWSPNTDLTKTNVQQIFDNDKKLYDDIVATTNYSSDFQIVEVASPGKIEVDQRKFYGTASSHIFPELYYGALASSLTLSLPPGETTLMFGCKAIFTRETPLVFGPSTGSGKQGKLCGVLFGTTDETEKILDTVYAMFNNVGSGYYTSGSSLDNFYNAISGKTLNVYNNTSSEYQDVTFQVFLWSVSKGAIQMRAQATDGNYKFSNQFWIMRAG